MLHGQVTDVRGKPLQGAYLSVTDHAGNPLGSGQSSDDGRYEISVATAGDYRVWAGKSANDGYQYIPQIKSAEGLTGDFKLEVGANLVLAAYDPNGRRLTNGDFNHVSGGRVFVTDLAGNPAPGSLAAVPGQNASDWRWDSGWPAIIVAPGKRYRVLVQYELPQVGKLLFTLDNAGAGYLVDQAGGRSELNLNREIARSSLASVASLERGRDAAEAAASIRQGSQYLKEGDAALAMNPPDAARATNSYALSVKASLDAHENLVLARAKADIERNRKGDAQVTVLTASGRPVPGAKVIFEQTANDFLFGAHPLGRSGSYDPRLAASMRDMGINKSYVTARWGRIQSGIGQFDWDNIDAYQQPAKQSRDGFGLIGALSMWFTSNPDFSPAYLRTARFPVLRDAVYQYAYTMAQRYAGSIDVWELNELNLENANSFNLNWQQRVEIGQVFAKAVKSANPSAHIMSGSLALRYDATDSHSLTELLQAGVPADVVGIELYQAGVNADGVGPIGLDLVSIDRLLDQYAGYGKPVLVKEFSVPSKQVDGSSWWHRTWDEALQSEYVTKVYTLAFANSMVRGITWSWGVSDADAFIHDGGLLDDQMRPKQAYYALKRLIASWRTRGEATTDGSGEMSWRGFGGTYQVRIEKDGRELARTTIKMPEREQSRYVVRLTNRDLAQTD